MASATAESEDPAVTLAAMPQYVLSMILPNLSHRELSTAACACRCLAEAAADPQLWETLRLSVPPYQPSERKALPYGWAIRLAMRCTSLRVLDFSGLNDLVGDTEVVQFVMDAPRLTACNLSFTAVSDTSLLVLAKGCPALVSLDLQCCHKITVAGLREVVAGLGSLRTLGVAHCRQLIDEKAAAALACICERPSLTALDLDGWEGLDDQACRAIAQCPGLTSFTLDGANVTSAGLIACVEALPQLQSLSVSFCERLSDEGVLQLRALGLRSLRLRKGVALTDGAISQTLLDLKLERLDMSECPGLRSQAVEALAHSSGAFLQEVCLAWCWYIGDNDIHQLLLRCPLLVHLDCTGLEELTDEAFSSLQERTPVECSWASGGGRLVGQDLVCLLLKGCSYVADEAVHAMVSSHPQLVVVDYWGVSVCSRQLANELPTLPNIAGSDNRILDLM